VVSSVTITNPGSNYTSVPTVTFSAPPSGTTATGVAMINGSGQVTGVLITNAGTGYTVEPTVTFSAPPSLGTVATGTANVDTSQSANLTMIGTLVDGNRSLGQTGSIGGGICNAGDGTSIIQSSTIANNFAGLFGGGFSDGEVYEGTLAVSNSLFVNNSADLDNGGNGGAMFLTVLSASISNTEILGNASANDGGGVFDNAATLTIVGSTFSGNIASGNGGGVLVLGSPVQPLSTSITNCTFAHNRALNNTGGGNGGAIDAPTNFVAGVLKLVNDTINGNYASSGGGLFWAGQGTSTISVQNSVIATNIALTAGPDANNPGGTFTDNGGNLIGIADGSTGFTAPTTQTGTAASPLNPLLGPLQNNGGPTVGAPARPDTLGTEIPLAGSPLLDKGVASGAPTTDQRGYLRPEDTGGDLPDVGAVEFLTSQERFVQALYLDELGRPGTLAELDGWVKVLNGTGGRRAVVAGIAGSFEARDRVVKGWYQTFLGRTAMNGEENFWAKLLATQTQEQALSQILGSGEFFNHAQTLGFSGSANSQFVQALYSLLLNRIPGSAEINAWLNLLPSMGRQGAALAFLESQEYRTDTVQTDYVDLLHRIGDNLGLNFWVTSSLDLAKIRVSLESSLEFFGNG
jgi:hypothetical protein